MARLRTPLIFAIGFMLLATLASCPPDQLDHDGGTGNIRKGDALVDASNIIEKYSKANATFPGQNY